MKSLLGLLRKPSPPAAVLRAQLNDMPTAIETAERRADELEAKRRTVLLEGSDDDLAKIEAEIAAANRQVERLFAAQSELEKRLADADREAAEAERQARYDTAIRQSAEAQKALQRYPKLADEIRAILDQLCDAERAVEAANAELPPGASALPGVEAAVRGLPGEPRKVLSENIQDAWFYTGPHARWGRVEDEFVKDIQSTDGRTGFFTRNLDFTQHRYTVECRQVRRTEYLEERGSMYPTPLGADVALPEMFPLRPDPRMPPRREVAEELLSDSEAA